MKSSEEELRGLMLNWSLGKEASAAGSSHSDVIMAELLQTSELGDVDPWWNHDIITCTRQPGSDMTQFRKNTGVFCLFFLLNLMLQGPHMEEEIPESGRGMQRHFYRFVGAVGRRKRKKSRRRFSFCFEMEKCFFVFPCNNLITSQLLYPKELLSRWDNSLFVSLFLLKSAPRLWKWRGKRRTSPFDGHAELQAGICVRKRPCFPYSGFPKIYVDEY